MSIENPVRHREPFTITPSQLIEANQSPLAQTRLKEYKDARDANNLTLTVVCSDARSGPSWINRNDVRADRSIAAGGDPAKKADAIRDPHVARIVIATHFSMSGSTESGFFRGCGGLAAYDAFSGIHRNEAHTNPVAPYIQKRIGTNNPFVEAFNQKDEIMKLYKSDGDFKPIMIAPLAHDTGLLMPVWYMDRDAETGGYITKGFYQSHDIQNQERIRPDNIHTLQTEVLPEGFGEIIRSNDEFVSKNGRLLEAQKVQDPGVIFVTTKATPLRVRFGDRFDEPNRVFVVGVAFEKVDGGEVVTDSETPLEQVSYPIGNNLKAGKEGDEFYSTRTIVFEAGEFNEARLLALRFADKPWAQEWLRNRGGKIIVTEAISGNTTRAEYLEV